MRRVLLLIVAFVSASTATSAQILEGRLKQIHESKVVKLAYRSDASLFPLRVHRDNRTAIRSTFEIYRPLHRTATKRETDHRMGAR